jgi:large subunit ribosomal protein L21
MKSSEMFVVMELCGRQWKVCEGDEIVTEKIEAQVGDIVRVKDVLLAGGAYFTVVGQPLIKGAIVDAVVEEQFVNGKITKIKYRETKNTKLKGHRQHLTRLRIAQISVPSE